MARSVRLKSFTLSPSKRKQASINSLTIDRTSLSSAPQLTIKSLEPSLLPSFHYEKGLIPKLFYLECPRIKSASTILKLEGKASSTMLIFSSLEMSSFALKGGAIGSQVPIFTHHNHRDIIKARKMKIFSWTSLEITVK